MYLLKNPKRVDARTGQPFVVSGVLTDRARARLVVHQQHAQHLYQAAVWVYVARMGNLGLLRAKDRPIYSQATPADFPSLVVIQEQGTGTLTLYAAYQHVTLRSPSAMTAEECVAAVYALEFCKLGAGVARLALSFCFGAKPLPSLITSHPAFCGDPNKRQMFAASTILRPEDVVRLQVSNVEVGWRATVCGKDTSVAGVVTLTLLELIDGTGVVNKHAAAPYPAAPLYNLAAFQEQRGAHWGSSGPPSTIAGLQRELGKNGDGACFLWLEQWLLDIRTQAPLFLDVAKYLLESMVPTKLE
jgi:hypothetical protein